jgi:hypothetical protein
MESLPPNRRGVENRESLVHKKRIRDGQGNFLSPPVMAGPEKAEGAGARATHPFPPIARCSCVVVDPQLHPLVPPQVSHFMQVPLRSRVKFPHWPHASPS